MPVHTVSEQVFLQALETFNIIVRSASASEHFGALIANQRAGKTRKVWDFSSNDHLLPEELEKISDSKIKKHVLIVGGYYNHNDNGLEEISRQVKVAYIYCMNGDYVPEDAPNNIFFFVDQKDSTFGLLVAKHFLASESVCDRSIVRVSRILANVLFFDPTDDELAFFSAVKKEKHDLLTNLMAIETDAQIDDLITKGSELRKSIAPLLEERIKSAVNVEIPFDGEVVDVLVFPASDYLVESGKAVAESFQKGLSMSYRFNSENKVMLSLRKVARCDLSCANIMAKVFGGGGGEFMAGVTLPLDSPKIPKALHSVILPSK